MVPEWLWVQMMIYPRNQQLVVGPIWVSENGGKMLHVLSIFSILRGEKY